jgi:hypothetical protein
MLLSDLGMLNTASYYYVMIWLLLNFVFGMVLKVRKDDGSSPELHIGSLHLKESEIQVGKEVS